VDHWHAECLPCKWQEAHDTQDAALSAAEEHVFSTHAALFRLPSDVRSRKMADEKIGHVQYRADDAVATAIPPFPLEHVVAAAPFHGDIQPEPAAAAAAPALIAGDPPPADPPAPPAPPAEE